MTKPIIGITMGDPAGIGPEIIVKALENNNIYRESIPVIFGTKESIEDAIDFTASNLKLNLIDKVENAKGEFGEIDLLDFDNIHLTDFNYGEINAKAGEASIEYIFEAIEMAKSKRVDAVVTGPIHKEAIAAAGYKYPGHTEIFAEKTDTKDFAMMLTHEKMRVIHVSTHVSLREACNLVKKDRVLSVIKLANESLKKLGISNPLIGVAGLNPHAGEQGLFGDEEINEIIPAVEEAKEENINVRGPESPDTIFSKLKGGDMDVVVVMYHDQGHIPMKITGFEYDKENDRWTSVSGVNSTVGLPIIRTSVDHGTAFGKAGEGRAAEDSMIEAIKMAAQFASER